MDIVQTFYNQMATKYDKLFEDWDASSREQGQILDRLFQEFRRNDTARLLDCACGIGTQAIGLAELGYSVTASDISLSEIAQAKIRAQEHQVNICFAQADFRMLPIEFHEQFDIVIAMDNALPHMLSRSDLEKAIQSIMNTVAPGGIFVASIRDYDALLLTKPAYSPPYIHKTGDGHRVCIQTWEWEDDQYNLIQYIIEDGASLEISKFECVYRATRREEISGILADTGCMEVIWRFPEETGYYQPIVIARKKATQA